MRRRLLLAALAAMLAIALVWRLARDPDVAPPLDPSSEAPVGTATPATASTPTPSASPAAEPRADAGTDRPAANVATRGLQLRVRLRGLHPAAPWTAPLRLDLDGRDEAAQTWLEHDGRQQPDAQGLATFTLPDWCATASQQKGRIEADDPNYLDLAHRWQGNLDLARELVLDVQVVAAIEGRVVDDQRQPVAAARLTAFALRDGTPVDGELARANTRDDGTYRLVIPPNAPLFVLAAPMERATGSRMVTMDGSRPDTGHLRTDLLPASVSVRGTIGVAHRLDDIVLARGATISGSVRWSDGAPIALAKVRVLPRGGTSFDLDEAASVQRQPDGRLAPNAAVDTDDDGTFLLPAIPGAPVDVAVQFTSEARIVGQFQQPAVPPQRLDFLLPRPIRLRATDGRRPLPQATIEIAHWERVTADATGVFALIPTRNLRARAAHQRLRSPWVEVPLAAAGTTIDLEMTSARSEVSIEFTGDFRVRNTVITWRRDDGQQGREHLLRDDRGGPFQVFLEPGRYQLTVGPGGGERNGVFLLPLEHEVEVGGDPVALRLTAVFGGTFTVMATDSSGVWVGGTCQLRDGNGADVTERFRVQDGPHGREGGPGELLPGGVNAFTRILPPGDYELMCDFGAHGAHRQLVTIRPRDVTEVRIRLP